MSNQEDLEFRMVIEDLICQLTTTYEKIEESAGQLQKMIDESELSFAGFESVRPFLAEQRGRQKYFLYLIEYTSVVVFLHLKNKDKSLRQGFMKECQEKLWKLHMVCDIEKWGESVYDDKVSEEDFKFMEKLRRKMSEEASGEGSSNEGAYSEDDVLEYLSTGSMLAFLLMIWVAMANQEEAKVDMEISSAVSNLKELQGRLEEKIVKLMNEIDEMGDDVKEMTKARLDILIKESEQVRKTLEDHEAFFSSKYRKFSLQTKTSRLNILKECIENLKNLDLCNQEMQYEQGESSKR